MDTTIIVKVAMDRPDPVLLDCIKAVRAGPFDMQCVPRNLEAELQLCPSDIVCSASPTARMKTEVA